MTYRLKTALTHGLPAHGGASRTLLGSPKRRIATTAALGAAALVLAGCSAASPVGGASSSGAATGELSAASIKTITAYTGSKAGKADDSLTPVTWGYVNQEGGALSFPQYTKQVNALVKAVNTQLGGIGGHPLKLDVCHVISSDEDGQSCGQQFANDKAISAILQFPLINGDAAFHRVIDPTGIPVFGPSANSIDDASPKNDFFTTGPNFSNVAVIASYTVNTVKAKNVAILGIQGDPLSQLIDAQLTDAFKAAGVTTKLATVAATSSDVTAPLVAAGVQQSDAIVATLSTAPLCASVFNALKTLGATSTPVVSTQFCSSEDTKALIGDYPKWSFVGGYPDPRAKAASSRESSELAVAQDLWVSTGSAKGELDFAAPSLQAFLTTLAVVNKAGKDKTTTASIEKAALAFKGPLFLGEDKVSWGTIPGLPAVGSLAQRVYRYAGNGKWVDAANGWLEPPAPSAP